MAGLTRPPGIKRVRDLVDGVLLLDKPVGWSSNDALIKVKRVLNAKKAGHTGTLDPFATGLLPLCFGEATKFSQDLLEADKTYETVVHLGVSTDTGDTEGAVLATREVDVTREQIYAVLERFRGDIMQVPPMYSALKRDGKPLYEYARAGITLEREARPVTIHQLEFISYEAPFLTLSVMCSKGTYIRVLGEDIGAALGCGAHLNALRRTKVGTLTIAGVITLDALTAHAEPLGLLEPVDALLSSFPAILLDDALAKRFLHGQRIALGKENVAVPDDPGRVRVYHGPRLLGTGQLQEYAILAPERLIATAHPPN
ncbi:tRNA pseudouridine(55) synthase TruB [Janthinobacterium agaricidamnosum]|uniref:tRNA pseudouridine synthase B n=1 Tax=Janthinobacterium agaricidamnosum NBRC 102515 = DSM 9628 TaxID=1349767 RepID=W0VC18_9BURK|nr:tRNA pseudouridine(55) synthase TruB [Janthinobacterium agaricidamnosum]CDG84898.1 tRNA pseudouridine synthase B [Janthinobacterium agaricidamnosum NBRC 102515 = DSM 9628]